MKGIYRISKQLSKQFYCYYSKLSNNDKQWSLTVAHKIQQLLCFISNQYFGKESKLEEIITMIKEIEFLIRDLKDNKILLQQQFKTLSQVFYELNKYIKEYKNELYKQK